MKRISIFKKSKSSANKTDDDNASSGSNDVADEEDHNHNAHNDDGGNEADGKKGSLFKKHNRNRARPSEAPTAEGGTYRPSYRTEELRKPHVDHDDSQNADDDEDDHNMDDESVQAQILTKAENIEKSAGTTRLNRILRSNGNNNHHHNNTNDPFTADPDRWRKTENTLFGGAAIERTVQEKIANPKNLDEVGQFCGRVVLPPLKVDPHSIGGSMLDGYPESMQQECLLAAACESFESSGSELVTLSALQYPNDYSKHKRALGLFGVMGTKGRASKLRYVLIARSTNRPLLAASQRRQQETLRQKHQQQHQQLVKEQRREEDADESSRGDYDAMFAPEDDGEMSMSSNNDNMQRSVSSDLDLTDDQKKVEKDDKKKVVTIEEPVKTSGETKKAVSEEEEISSFPVLVCMTLHSDGTGPDIRKLVPLDQLTTVQDLHSTVVQLAFSNGDTIRLDFGDDDVRNKVVERSLDKERFIWSLLQIHAMLCMAVVEARGAIFLPPLNVRNLDRAELQYVATVNGFLKKDETLRTLLERQRKLAEEQEAKGAAASGEEKLDVADMDTMAYDLMMGNFATRVTLFHSEDERKDAEEILNSTEWTDMLSKEETAAVSVAERLGFMLQSRMRDLEAETCRRLIAWEDEKHLSLVGRAKLHDDTDARDTVDALALASLFKTLESLDSELKAMEDWLQDRAAAIKPLTDDCADIEEENRQLEQQWKSYDMLGAEMRRLLHGQEIDEKTESILKNPASALFYDDDGLVDVDESEEGIDRIYEAGKALLDAMEFVSKALLIGPPFCIWQKLYVLLIC